jgi:uncharacterized membrane protein YhaH (DUF805 family)
MSERLRDISSGASEPKPRGFGAWIGGRARRREYWLWIIPTMIAAALLQVSGLAIVSVLLTVAVLFAWIRRLHDLGYSGWLAPLINVGVVIVNVILTLTLGELGASLAGLLALAPTVALGVLPGEPSSNEYGPPPGQKDVADAFG